MALIVNAPVSGVLTGAADFHTYYIEMVSWLHAGQ